MTDDAIPRSPRAYPPAPKDSDRRGAASDPLLELARLIGQSDPFGPPPQRGAEVPRRAPDLPTRGPMAKPPSRDPYPRAERQQPEPSRDPYPRAERQQPEPSRDPYPRAERYEPEPPRDPYPRAGRYDAEPPREEKPARSHPFPSLQTFPARPVASDPPAPEAYRPNPYSHDPYAAPARPEPAADRYPHPGYAPEPEPAPRATAAYPSAQPAAHPADYHDATYPTVPDQHYPSTGAYPAGAYPAAGSYPAAGAAGDHYPHLDGTQPEAADHEHEPYAEETEHQGEYDPQYAAAGEEDQYEDYDYAPGEEDVYEDEPGTKRRNTLKIALAALGVVVFGTAAAFGYRMVFHGGSDGPPPLIRADNSPTKVMAPSLADASAKPINDRLGAGDRMVSREEQPIDLRDATRGGVAPVAGGASVAPYPSSPSTTSAAPASAAATEPKKVRTVTIRADAGTAGGDRATPGLMAPTAAAPTAAAPRAAAPAAPAAQSPPSQPAVAAVDTTRPAPPPRARPTEGGWVVQIAAQKTEAEAQAAFRAAQAKFSALAGYQPLIRKKDQGERGVFYATQVGPVPREEANQLCENLKTAGGSCFIQRN